MDDLIRIVFEFICHCFGRGSTEYREKGLSRGCLVFIVLLTILFVVLTIWLNMKEMAQ